jgi:hypothetical protein
MRGTLKSVNSAGADATLIIVCQGSVEGGKKHWLHVSIAHAGLITVWLCLSLGIPSFVKGPRKDGSWEVAPWWAMLTAGLMIWLINYYYHEHDKVSKAQNILRDLSSHIDNNDYRSAVQGLKQAAFDRQDWDTHW